MKWVRDAYAPVRHGRTVVYGLGLTGIPVYNVNNNCSTGSTALFMGKQLHCSALGFEHVKVVFEEPPKT
ncbi:MAG TPA: hypothetical protein VF902_10120 [Coriobacteriia bacterium]